MKRIIIRRILGTVCAIAILASTLTAGLVLNTSAASIDDILAAAEAYVKGSGNATSLDGLLKAVKKIDENAKISENNFYVKHAVPGAEDDDEASGYKFSAPGSDGAVVTIIEAAGEKIPFTYSFSHQTEVIHIEKTAIVGKDEGFRYDASGNVVAYTGDADKIIFPTGYNGTMAAITNDDDFPNRDKVKIVMLRNGDKRIPLKAGAFNGFYTDYKGGFNSVDISQWKWKSLVGLDIYSDRSFLWQTSSGKTYILDSRAVESLPSLKYLLLPKKLDNRDCVGAETFTKLPRLQNVKMPASYVLSKAFTNTALREIELNHDSDSNFSSNSNYGFSGGTINVVSYKNSPSFIRAAAILGAAVHEQIIAGKPIVEAAENARNKITGWSNDGRNYIKSLSVTEKSGWTAYAKGTYCLFEIADGDSKFVFRVEKETDMGLDETEKAIISAASKYVDESKNLATLSGLLNAVKNVNNEVTLADSDFYIKHAVPGVSDDDTVSGYPLKIAGSDGAVSAIFKFGEKEIKFVRAFSRSDDVININAVAIAGKSEGFVYDKSGNVIGYTGTADKIVFPAGYKGTLGETTLDSFPGKNAVKVIMFKNGDTITPLTANALSGIDESGSDAISDWAWRSLVAVDVYSEYDYHWQTKSGKTQILQQKSIHHLPALKYLALPYALDDAGDWMNNGNISYLPLLENVNVPVKSNIGGKSYWNTGLRELVFGAPGRTNYVSDGGRVATNETGYGPTGGTRNIIQNSTQITFVQASAMAAAAINEIINEGASNSEVTARSLNEINCWSNESQGYVRDMTVSFMTDWQETDTSAECKIKISHASDSTVLYAKRSKTLMELSADYEIKPDFSPDTTEYTVNVPNEITELKLSAVPAAGAQIKEISGNQNFTVGSGNKIKITVISTSGQEIVYGITVTRNKKYSVDEAVEAAKNFAYAFEGKNSTTQAEYADALKSALSITGSDTQVLDFSINDAIDGAEDNYGVLVPGYNGYIAAKIKITLGSDSRNVVIKTKIKSTLKKYVFTADEVSSAKDFMISSDGKTLEYYTGNAKKVVIPEGIEVLDLGWFDGNTENVQVIIFPESLIESAGSGICSKLRHLEVVRFGDNFVTLPGNAFENCYMLQYVKLPERLESIGPSAFQYTALLQNIYIPNSVTSIGAKAFWQSGIRYAVVPAGLKNLGNDAFSYPSCGAGDVSYLVNDIKDQAEIDFVNKKMQPYVNINPRIIVLCKDVKFDNCFSSNSTGRTGTVINVYAPESQKEMLTTGKANSDYHFDFNQSFTMAAAFVQSLTDNAVITNKSTADDVLNAVQSSYCSLDVINAEWTVPYKVINGRATGTVRLYSADSAFDVEIDRPVYKAFETVFYDFNYENNDDFIIETEYETIETTSTIKVPVESTEENNEPQQDSTRKVIRKKKVIKHISDEVTPWYMSAWAIAGGCVLVAVVIAGTTMFIIVKKKKKKGK